MIKSVKLTISLFVAMFMMLFALNAFAATYTYDELNRLKTVTYSNGNILTYTYDAVGNILTSVLSTPPSVTTSSPATSITQTTATVAGNVTSDGNATVSERGVVYSGSANPTTADSKVSVVGTTGALSANLTSLTSGTTYHARAYATNSIGTSYGADVSFTAVEVPSVTTSTPATNITQTAATVGGNVTSDGGASIAERGVVYSANANPTTANSKLSVAGTTGVFSVDLTGLASSTTYHARAYATNSIGTSYGADITFTTATPYIPPAMSGQTIGPIVFTPATLAVNGTTTASATASSWLGVTFISSTPAICTVTGTTVTGVKAGICTITADQNGNTNYSAAPQITQNIVIPDTTAPNLTISTLADNAIANNATLNVSGTVSDNDSGIKHVSVNGQTASLFPNDTFTIAITLANGINTVTTIATDNANNTTTDTRTITFDSAAPILTITTPADNSVTGKTFTDISGNVNDSSATVTAKVNGGTGASVYFSGTNFTVTLNLTSGLNTIDITAIDQAGNSTSTKRTVTSETAAPTLAITAPVQDISTTQGNITISGTVTDSVTITAVSITVDGQTYAPVVGIDGSFSHNIVMATDKTYAVIVTATDQAGNMATVQRNIIKTAPLATGDINGDVVVDIADALKVLRIALGLDIAIVENYGKADVAPLVNGKPSPDGVIDIADAAVILQKVVGSRSW